MEINQGLYPGYLLASLIVGMLLSVVYDAFRIGRRLRRSEKGGKGEWTLLFFEDLLFFAIAAVAAALLSYAMNRGRVRYFGLLCLALGFALWRVTLSKPLMSLALRILRFIGRMGKQIWNRTFARLIARCESALKQARGVRRTARELKRLITEAEHGKRRNS